MKRIWVKKPKSFKEAQHIDIDYYLSMSPSERLDTVQFLREILPKFKLGEKNEKNQKDYEEFLKLFNKHEVKYCIVGAFAVAFYAVPRYTKDMDILVEPSIENGRRIKGTCFFHRLG